MRTNQATGKKNLPQTAPQPPDGFLVTQDALADYMAHLRRKGLTVDTLNTYQRKVDMLWSLLPEDRVIREGTLAEIAGKLADAGYADMTINGFFTVANSFVAHFGHWELQQPHRVAVQTSVQPELTRTEYLRLLSAAKNMGDQRRYLLIKTIVCLGLNIQELTGLTVEMVDQGFLTQGRVIRKIPENLRAELMSYARHRGVRAGPIFITNGRRPMSRTYVTNIIKSLSHDARVDPSKCTPRCLRKLYQDTQRMLRSNLSLLLEQAHERILDQEQLTVGWLDQRVLRGTPADRIG